MTRDEENRIVMKCLAITYGLAAAILWLCVGLVWVMRS